MLSKEVGFEVPVSQMQYNKVYKEKDKKKIYVHYTLEGIVLDIK